MFKFFCECSAFSFLIVELDTITYKKQTHVLYGLEANVAGLRTERHVDKVCRRRTLQPNTNGALVRSRLRLRNGHYPTQASTHPITLPNDLSNTIRHAFYIKVHETLLETRSCNQTNFFIDYNAN